MSYDVMYQQSRFFQSMRQSSEEWRMIQNKQNQLIEENGIVVEYYKIKESAQQAIIDDRDEHFD